MTLRPRHQGINTLKDLMGCLVCNYFALELNKLPVNLPKQNSMQGKSKKTTADDDLRILSCMKEPM